MVSLGVISYGFAALGFLILTLLLATSWEGRAQGIRLILACAVTAAWATIFALGSRYVAMSTPLVLLVELLRYGAWFVVLTGLTQPTGIARGLSRAVHVVWAGGIALLLATPLLISRGVAVPDPVSLLSTAGLAVALLGLILVEQIYRNSREGGRYALKFFAIAVGSMFAYDLFVFSQAQLVKGIEPVSWEARGFIVALMVPMLAIAARRNPQWSLNIFVSRHVVFYSTTFLVVGGYLLLMAFGGYLIRLYGGTWGPTAQLVFFVGAGMALLAVMASGGARRRLRVFLSKHFYRNKYDYRIEWLRFIDTLSTRDPEAQPIESAVRSIAQIIHSPGGVVFTRVAGAETYVPAASWPAGEFDRERLHPVPRDAELVDFLARKQWVVDFNEYRASPDAYGNIALPPDLTADPRYRLVVPLLQLEQLVGFVLLASPPPPFDLTYEDRDLLKTVGAHVATYLAQHEADRQLAENRQFEAYHRLTAFVMHDLKNLAAQLQLIVSNAEKHKRNPEFVDDAISTVANSTERMQRLIEQLQGRETRSQQRSVSLRETLERACKRCAPKLPVPRLEPGEVDVRIEADPERLTSSLEHVIRNAQDATPDDGSVTVTVRSAGDQAVIEIADTGAGMTAEFVKDRLFKPFDTTKGSKGMGIGAFQVREYVQSLGGSVDVQSTPGQGTIFQIRLKMRGP